MKIELNYQVVNDIRSYLNSENTDIESFSKEAEISKSTISQIFKTNTTTVLNYERIYSFIYKRGYRLNLTKEKILKESNKLILFHGSKFGLTNIDVNGSRENCDFGHGLYLGESYKNAACFVCENKESSIYSFEMDLSGLKILEFDTSIEWMLAICFYRKTIKEYSNSKIIKDIIDRINASDVIIAPIADNRMFYIMSLFANGDINSEVAVHSLSASFLGKQYILKTKKAISKLHPIEKYYLCTPEKEDYINFLNTRTSEIDVTLKEARREYRNGLFIEELLK